MAKVLATPQRIAIVSALVEGNSIRATARIVGVSKDTVLKLMVELGEACAEYHDKNVRGLTCERIQADEAWSFVGAKRGHVRPENRGEQGDCWTWIAMDADTKLCISVLVGPRTVGACCDFIGDLADRVVGRFQFSTDALGHYQTAVENILGTRADYGQAIKVYGTDPEGERRYSPAHCISSERIVVSGDPDPDHISTSYIERQNLTLRMSCRRFTRLTNAFSRKVYNHFCAVALYAMHYNYARIHATLRITPAMAAGLTKSPWKVADLVALLPAVAHKGGRPRKTN